MPSHSPRTARWRLPETALVTALLLVPHGVAGAQTGDPGLERLQREVERLAEISGGAVGLGAIHLETGREVYLNRHERFPMASSYKVPIAVELLGRVDRGELRLDSLVVLDERDVAPGSGTLSRLFQVPGVAVSVRNLLELMMLISDNTATDVCLRLAGGERAVNARMRALGIDGLSVDRSTTALIADFVGIEGVPADGRISMDEYRSRAERVTPERREAAAAAFAADARDTSTPEAMARLLELVWREQALSASSAELLLDIMRRSTTGADRIRGMLPPWVDVPHKTGTIGGTTNDVGLIVLPDGAGHIVTVLFVKDSDRPVPQRERAIAQISRAVYDYFLFNPGHVAAAGAAAGAAVAPRR